MKYNFNNHILDSSTYLSYLFDNTHMQHTEFEKYIEDNQSFLDSKYKRILDFASSHDINLYPYIYTLEIVGVYRVESFRRYFVTSLLKNEMQVDIADELTDIAAISLEHLVAFIATCQHFFL